MNKSSLAASVVVVNVMVISVSIGISVVSVISLSPWSHRINRSLYYVNISAVYLMTHHSLHGCSTGGTDNPLTT